MEFSDAHSVQRHLRTLPASTFTDPGGSVHHLRHCTVCGRALVATEQDGTLFIDDAGTVCGTPVTTPDPATGCGCAELIGAEFDFAAGYSPYPDV
jgi:hypothetical protein